MQAYGIYDNNTEIKLIDYRTVLSYVKELKPLLKKGTVEERRRFIQSFLRKIKIKHPEIKIEYTVPLKKGELPNGEI